MIWQFFYAFGQFLDTSTSNLGDILTILHRVWAIFTTLTLGLGDMFVLSIWARKLHRIYVTFKQCACFTFHHIGRHYIRVKFWQCPV